MPLGAVARGRLFAAACAAWAILAAPAAASPVVALMPTADPIPQPEIAGHALVFPPALVAELAVPVVPRLSVSGYFGGSWFLDTFGGVLSASAKLSLTVPDGDTWGSAILAQSIGGFVVSRGEGEGGRIDAVAALVSSPVRPARFHGGLAVHSMPGSEYPGGRYDWSNPQVSFFGAGEWTRGRATYGFEALWGAAGADDGFDSTLLLLPAVRLRSGRIEWAITAGVGVQRFGSPVAGAFPVPPLVSVTVPLGS
ncbi:MAG: hypothetical protein ACE15D_11960 [Candidatus Eisenbacteria bacterium]